MVVLLIVRQTAVIIMDGIMGIVSYNAEATQDSSCQCLLIVKMKFLLSHRNAWLAQDKTIRRIVRFVWMPLFANRSMHIFAL